MCGIAGILRAGRGPVSEPLLARMGNLMVHRGPDDCGIFVDDGIGFIHRRLSILDLSPLGRQPMWTDDRRFVIVYNGECYNHLSLKSQLEAKGCRFRSTTDTEVILQGFREHGPAFVERMNGMFAFAIWDTKLRELFLFRDRVGIKPCYYSFSEGREFVFSSEVKPILAAGVAPRLNESALRAYLSLRYVPGEETLFANIQKLEPGTYLKLSQEKMKLSRHTYWSLLDQDKVLPLGEREAQERFRELLTDSVKGCMISDVPVGAFLSGGVDSSLITALMRQNHDAVETFTFGMGADIDESARARAVAGRIGARNTVTRLRGDDFRYYPRALWHLEEPIGDSIIVPTYLLAKAAARKVKVVELGEGADEIMGSYVHQIAMTYGNLAARLVPRALNDGGLKMLRHMPDAFWGRIFPYPAKLGRSGVENVIRYLENRGNPGHAYLDLVGLFPQGAGELLLARGQAREPSAVFGSFWEKMRNPDFTNRLQALDLRYWNADYTMLRMDKLTMAHSLEARVPYLDHRLIELCLQLPRRFKAGGFKQKKLMRNAFASRHLLPRHVLQAPKKAFYLPVEKCFDSRFEDFVRDMLSDTAIRRRGLFDLEYARALRDSPSRELVHNKQLTCLLCFELWASIFLDGKWETAPAT